MGNHFVDGRASPSTALLSQQELAARWGISPRTLEAERHRGGGCPYLKIGRLVRYRLADVERYEQNARRTSTSDKGAGGAA